MGRHLHFLRKASLSHCTSSTKPAHQFRAHHTYAINTTALHLLSRAEQIFESHSSRRNRVSPDRYFTDDPTPIPHITLAVLTRSGSRTMAAPPVSKRVSIQKQKASASPMVDVTSATPMDHGQPSQRNSAMDTSSPPHSATSVPTPLPSGPSSSHETHTNIVDPHAVVEKPQSTMMDSEVTCKQCGQSCLISAFSQSQLRKWEANSVCRSCLVKLEVSLDTPAPLEYPFLAHQVVAPDPRFILDSVYPRDQLTTSRLTQNFSTQHSTSGKQKDAHFLRSVAACGSCKLEIGSCVSLITFFTKSSAYWLQ
jgi:hypothetical protein